MIEVPYEELDQNIVELVRVFNGFPGVFTVGSCGGHANPKNYQSPEGSWDIVFILEIKDDRPTSEAWLSFEFLVYAFNNWFYRTGLKVDLSAYSAPPHFNEPGQTITFRVVGDEDPAQIAKELFALKKEFFVID